MNQNEPETMAPSISLPLEETDDADIPGENPESATSDSSSSSKGSTRIVTMERKMDEMSKDIQMLQKEKAAMEAENEKLRLRMQEEPPQAVLIADSQVMADESKTPPSVSSSPAASPSNNNNNRKKLGTAVVCCLLVAGAIAFGIVWAVRNETSPALEPAATNSPTMGQDNSLATMAPTTTTTPPDNNNGGFGDSLEAISFTVDQVQEEGRVFTIPSNTFPLYINASETNSSNRTTILMWNSRTNVRKGVMLELLDNNKDPPIATTSRSSSSSNLQQQQQQVIRGYYNPKEYTKRNDFQPGDYLLAVDYEPFVVPTGEDYPLKPPACSYRDYEIVSVQDDLGWNVNPENIRIGHLGVVGAWYEDFEYTFHVGDDERVESLWTDAVDIEIEYSLNNEDGTLSFPYESLVPSQDYPSLRFFPDGPVKGRIDIKFKGASFTNLNGLVTHRDSGGLHVAFCADTGSNGSGGGSPTYSPTNDPTMDRTRTVTNALERNGVSNPDPTALDWLTSVDTWLPPTSSTQDDSDVQWVERYALAVFFQQGNGNLWWSKNINWKAPGVDVCHWGGITCKNANNAVIELDLRNSGLSGTMATELSLLASLKRIRLWNDMIAEDGRIPSAITQLSNLQLLFMRNCGVNKIGEEVSRMSNLENLTLRGNRFSSAIPSDIYSLTKLTSLSLKECSFQSQIPSGISQLTDLEALDVSVNSLLAPLPEELTLLPKLRRFVAGQNPWSTTIPTWLSQLTALEQLYLAFSNMQGEIPSDISSLTRLTFLTFNANQFTGTIPLLPVTLTNCNMKNNMFADTTNKGHCEVDAGSGSGGGITSTPTLAPPTLTPTNDATNERTMALTTALDQIGVSNPDPTALHWLSNVDTWLPYINFQWIERYALVVFFQKANGDYWSKNSNWKTSGMDVCGWEGITCKANNAVLELDLRNAGLSGSVATELGLLSSLKRIRTQNDRIAEDGRIPSAITQLSNLQLLFMRNCGVNKIDEEVLGMTNLENLLLRGNRFFSTIPDAIFALTKLTSLNLKECSFQSQIPSQLSQLTDLEVLDVSVNSLIAPLPEELTLLPKLRRFVAGQNTWSTTLPTWFGQLTALEQLYLAFSNMQGAIPSEISQMTSLTMLTFNKNQLSGSIPPLPMSLTNCNLKNNQFSNTTNKGICTLS